jgi:hypothetical protein
VGIVDVISEPRQENVEDWAFLMKGGPTATYVIRVDRNEKAIVHNNAIDGTPVEVVLTLRDDKTNEVVSHVIFPVANLLSYSATKRIATIYATGESPVEKELARRKEAFEKRLRDREAALDEEFKL